MHCQICGTTGDNMCKCTKCGIVFCDRAKCIKQRFGLSSRSSNVCPQCGGYNCITRAK